MSPVRWILWTGTSVVMAAPVVAQPVSEAQLAAFDRADRTARGVLSTIGCARRTGELRDQGLFGPVDSLGQSGQCVWIGDRPYSVFLDADSAFEVVRQFAVVDPVEGRRVAAPFDTAIALAQVRATVDALRRGYRRFQRVDRPFAPVTLRVQADSVEVWLVPLGALVPGMPVTAGGEHGFIYSPDGRRLVREVNAFDRFRPFTVPDTGQVVLASQEAFVPLVGELVLLNRLHSEGRSVAIRTRDHVSTLTRGIQSVWVHAQRQ